MKLKVLENTTALIKKKKINMNIADRLVKILEENGVKHIFGHPGEQILPFYKALQGSKIQHILMRHEQAAIHACDAYSRSSSNLGVCVSTAGPGAMNLTMGLATAFKDNVPILVITGDNSIDIRNEDHFQSIAISKIFKNITFKSFNPKSVKELLNDFYIAIQILNKNPKGPVHINLSKDLLTCSDISIKKPKYDPVFNYDNLNKALDLIKKSKKPLIIAGSGIKYSNSIREFRNLVYEKNIPIVNTYPAKGIISEFDEHNLGLLGIRGSKKSNYALKNSDMVIALGSKLSERTVQDLSFVEDKLIHVNIDEEKLKGKCKIHGNLAIFLKELNSLNLKFPNEWIDEINSVKDDFKIQGLDSHKLNPQIAIKNILNCSNDSLIINDAGTHTTWTTIMSKISENSQLIFSGSFAPMGYGIPGAIGSSIGNPSKDIVLIVGDGGFQMNIQELATISNYKLPIKICLINNNELGIIRQYEEDIYNMEKYQVDLDNPDFIDISNSYGISSEKVNSIKNLKVALKNAFRVKKPYFIEIMVESENIPLPK